MEATENPSDMKDDNELPATQIVDDRVLKGVVAYAEVRSANDNRTESVRRELEQLGAMVVKKFTDDVTHVVFKEGSKRTLTKAQKKGVHLVSVLWVENCKLNQEHVSERMYPAVVPKLKGTPLLLTKLKKAKSMQPVDFEEELANSTEKLRKKRRKLAVINKFSSYDDTPTSSPRPVVLVHDTQPRYEDEGYVLTPIRLTIPDTPPSMREKMKQIRLAREARQGSTTDAGEDDNDDADSDTLERHVTMQQLQRNLFKSMINSQEGASDTSVDKELIKLANNINSTLNNSGVSSPGSFGSQNLLNSQEISSVANSSVKFTSTCLKSPKAKATESEETNEISLNDIVVQDSETDRMQDNQNADDVSPVIDIDNKKETKKRRGRVSRKMSVKQVVAELDKTNLISQSQAEKVNREFEDENPIPAANNGISNNDTSLGSNTWHGKHVNNVVRRDDAANESHNIIVDRSSNNNSVSSHTSKGLEKMDHVLDRSDNDTNNSNSVFIEKIDPEIVNTAESIKSKKRQSNRGRSSKSSLNTTETVGRQPARRRRSIANTDDARSQNVANGEVKTENSPGKKGKRTMKKKLLSLTDLTDRHSILVEPTKFSQVERTQLISSQGKKGRKKTPVSTGPKSSSTSTNCNEVEPVTQKQKSDGKSKGRKSREQDTSCDLENGDVENVANVNSKKGKGRPSSSTMKGVSESATQASGRRKRSSVVNISGPNRKSKRGKSVSTLVNDTHVETVNDSKVDTGDARASQLSKIQDVTTHLNLTKDNSLVCSIRETTLSLSMSTAYTDANMPSFLQRDRRSVDEFNLSQRKTKNMNGKKRSVLATVDENNSNKTSSESDQSVTGRKKARLDHSGHKKWVRPSIVMTSLHSHEQDVVISVVKKLGGFIIAESVNETTSHVICGEPRRTLNILQCLARGIWLLSKEWVLKSLEAGKWISELEHEMDSFFPACKLARLEREKCAEFYRQTIFADIGPVYISGRASPPRQHLVQLLKLCGGKVTDVRDKASVYVGSDYHPGLTCVKTVWLLDSISGHKVMPMDRYFLDRPKRESSPVY